MLFNILTKIIAINSQDKIIKFSSFKCTLHKSMIKNRSAFSKLKIFSAALNQQGRCLFEGNAYSTSITFDVF